MNAGVDEELPRSDDSSWDADVSPYEYTIMYDTQLPRYGVRFYKCARGKNCAYGDEGRIQKGQLRWECADYSTGVRLETSYHLRCLSDTSAIEFLNRARLEREFREASEEEIIEGFLDGFHDILLEDFHREGVKSVLLKLFKRKPFDEADHAFFNRVDLPRGVTFETAANETVKKLIQLGGGGGGDLPIKKKVKAVKAKPKAKAKAKAKVKKKAPSKRKTAPATTTTKKKAPKKMHLVPE
jgi:hypothetical protein